MKTYYVRLKSLSNLACEVQEIKAGCQHRACEAGRIAAEDWCRGNDSEAVRWRVEDFSGSFIGGGEWTAAPQPDPDAEKNVTLTVSLNEARTILAALSRRISELESLGGPQNAGLAVEARETYQSIDQQAFGGSQNWLLTPPRS